MALSDDVRQFLGEKRFAVLGTIGREGVPHQTVMWYELRGDDIIMNTKVGRLKEWQLRRDPRCSVCVGDAYTYVTITGTAQLIDDPRIAQDDIKRLSTRYYGPEKAERQVREQFSKEQRVTIRLPVERVIAYGVGDEA